MNDMLGLVNRETRTFIESPSRPIRATAPFDKGPLGKPLLSKGGGPPFGGGGIQNTNDALIFMIHETRTSIESPSRPIRATAPFDKGALGKLPLSKGGGPPFGGGGIQNTNDALIFMIHETRTFIESPSRPIRATAPFDKGACIKTPLYRVF